MVPERKNGVQKVKHDKAGLGRALINKKARIAREKNDPTLHTTEIESGLSSVTEQDDLATFLSTAALADTSFTAEKQNIKVISMPSVPAMAKNQYLLSEEEEKEQEEKQKENRERLQVPRRPKWTRDMRTQELERSERDYFLSWRRGLAELQQTSSLLLTPFELNLEVWRQLWRTLERSDLIVQIVDARNPVGFRSQDLARYVEELNDEAEAALAAAPPVPEADEEPAEAAPAPPKGQKGKERPPPRLPTRKANLLLLNKSDLLTKWQREQWADYFEKEGIEYAFFSALNAAEVLAERAAREAREAAEEEDEEEQDDDDEADNDEEESEEESEDEPFEDPYAKKEEPTEPESPRTRILTVLELEDLFLSYAPKALEDGPPSRLNVGLVGYPNVGKSSTINALLGEKKVSVSSTPGKTKHFQTLPLTDAVQLCDCPGLVFPQFTSTKAALVCDGVLPIDQMREHTGPVGLVARRIPKEVLEGMYGMKIECLPIEEGGTGIPTSSEVLAPYALARGFFTSGQGNPDESRASRLVLKDYVNGKLLYVYPPPSSPKVNDGEVFTGEEFNEEFRDREVARLAREKKKAPTQRVGLKSSTYIHHAAEPKAAADGAAPQRSQKQSYRAQALDQKFFEGMATVGVTLGGQMFPHRGRLAADGTVIRRAGKAKQGMEASQLPAGKKHYKQARKKNRSVMGEFV